MNNKLRHVQNWPEIARAAQWSANALAKLTGVSKDTLRRRLLLQFGKSPKVWLAIERQRQAVALLRGGSTIKETAVFLGYKQQTNFTRQFKAYWGVCPSYFINTSGQCNSFQRNSAQMINIATKWLTKRLCKCRTSELNESWGLSVGKTDARLNGWLGPSLKPKMNDNISIIGTQSPTSLSDYKIATWFACTSGVILSVTGLAKIPSVFGSQQILDLPDPLFAITFRHLLFLIGSLELIVSGICFGRMRIMLKLGLVAWLGSFFLLYRIGLLCIGWKRPCPCLGGLYDAIHLSPQIASVITNLLLIYLLGGSYSVLWFKNLKHSQQRNNE